MTAPGLSGRLSAVRETSGVYLILDLDDEPIYGGKSGQLRSRLTQHFVRQDSSVTADGLLDLYEVRRILIWYIAESDLDRAEATLYQTFRPRWNRAVPRHSGDGGLALGEPSTAVDVIATEEELALRREPMQRAENKVLHLLRAVRKARISGASPNVQAALRLHSEELTRHLNSR